MSQQGNGPQGAPQGQPQGQQYGQANQGQPQQWNNNGQPGYAPSAYSAPAPGYGQPQFAPSEPSAFGALFSTNFSTRFTGSLAKLVMLFGIIAASIYAGYALFDLITLLTADYGPYGEVGAMTIISSIIYFAFRVSIAFVLLGFLRVALEYFVDEEKGSPANK